MAAGYSWYEDNGPVNSKSTSTGRTGCFWKNADTSVDSDYTTYPIQAGNCSFIKYQYVTFSGTFNTITNCILSHTAGVLANMSLKCLVTSVYVQPAPTPIQNATDISAIGSSTSGVAFSTSGPGGPTVNSLTSSGAGSTQYLATQLQTTTSASSGDIGSIILTLSYDET